MKYANRFSEELLCMESTLTPLSDAQWLLVPYGFNPSNSWLEDVCNALDGTYLQYNNCKCLFICFLAAMSDEDLIELQLTSIPLENV